MNSHLSIVALELRVAGWIIGAPSLLSTLGLMAGAFALRQSPANDNSPPLDVKTYGLFGLLDNGARAVARIFEFVGGAAAWIVTALAIVSAASALVGVTLYLTGRGVQNLAAWARFLAILIFLAWLPAVLATLSVLPRPLLPLGWLLIGAALYSLWVLVWRFN